MTKKSPPNPRYQRFRVSSLVLLLVVAPQLAGVQEASAAHAPPSQAGNTTSTSDASSMPTGGAPKNSGGSTTPTGQNAQPQQQSTGASSAPIESQILAFAAMGNRAKEIAAFILTSTEGTLSKDKKRKVVVLDPAQLELVKAYQSFDIQAATLRKQLCTALTVPINKPAPHAPQPESLATTAAAVSAAAAALSATASLFKETRTVTPNSPTLPDEALIAAVASELSHLPNIELYYPTAFPIGLLNPDTVPPVIADANIECQGERGGESVYERTIALQFLRQSSEQQLAVVKAEQPVIQNPAAIAALTSVNKIFDTAISAWSAVDSTTNRAGWDGIVRGEKLAKVLNDNSHLVELKVQSSGGEVISLDGPFFFHGAKYFYSGGVIVTVVIFDATTGRITAAKNFWEMSGNVERKVFQPSTNPP